MEDLLIQVLEEFKYPVYRQGSIGKDEPYPDRFFTFWSSFSTDQSHYDNEPFSYVGRFDVNFYSIIPEETYSVLESAKESLKANGFIINGLGYDVLSDEESHTGRGMEALYQQINNLKEEQ